MRRIYKSMIWVSVLALSAGAVSAQKAERKNVREGNKLYESEKYTESEIAYRKSLEVNPRSTEGTYNLGNSLYKQGKFPEAAEQYQLIAGQGEKMVATPEGKARLSEVYHNMGNIFMQNKDYGKAVEVYKQSLRLNPKDDETRYNLALAQKLLSDQQNQDQSQDQQNDDKQENKDQKDDQQQQQQQQPQDDQKQDKTQEQQQSNEQMSKDNAQQMLDAFLQDEKDVPSYSFPLFAGQAPHFTPFEKYPGEYTYKYPKTGEVNSKVSVHTFDIKSKVTRKINVPVDADGYIPRIRFTQDPNKLAVMTLNRHQNRFDLYFADPRSTVAKLALRDESDTYIRENVFDNIVFYPENFSFVSEKSGYNHLYWYSIGGNLLKQVTAGPYEVQEFLGYDPEEGSFYFSSNEESPMRSAIYKIDRKGKKTRLSSQAGTNSAQFSANMKYYMNRYSNLDTPTVITLNDNTGKTLATLMDNAALKQDISGYDMPRKEFFTFQTSDGTTLNGWMMKPADFSAGKKYPVLMYQYSGPGSQQVLDKFSVSWETYMASQGYIVVCVDGRGTGGRGAEFAKCTYLNLGIKEAKDQVETALYMGNQPYVDKKRIGIWGWSYGGYMTIMSMSEGTPVFKAGVAVAAVTDWNYYDTVYGERFMRTPKENAEGYKASSTFTRADKLHGNLLLVHGMADDNVHFQNCAEYAEQLVQLGKQFDMQVYTNRNHSIYGGNTRLHLYTRLTNFFNKELK